MASPRLTLPNKARLFSELLTLHLDRSIARYGRPRSMSKFTELADFTTETMAEWDAEAQALLDEGQRLKAQGREIFAAHRLKQAEARAGFAKMRDAVRDMIGGNAAPNPPGEASPASPPSFPADPQPADPQPDAPKAA